MGALETIDWDKLDGEIYSVIAHASAGTDFCSPDLQMAVDGCIAEMKRAMKAKDHVVQNRPRGHIERRAIMRIFECMLSTVSAECKHRQHINGVKDTEGVAEIIPVCQGFFSDFTVKTCPYRSPIKIERVTGIGQQPQES